MVVQRIPECRLGPGGWLRRKTARLLAFCLAIFLPQWMGATANSAEPRAGARPLAVVAGAGLDRWMEDAETVAVAAERRDLYDMLKGTLTNFGDFDGMDRAKPFGAFVFLGEGLPPKPEVVGFVPVADAEKLLKTLAFGPIRTAPVAGKEGRHEIQGPDGKIYLQFQGKTAFLAQKPESLDQPYPEPGPLVDALTAKYDFAARVDLTVIPDGLKGLLVATARARAETDHQKALEKPRANADELRLRKEISDAALESLEALVKDGREIVVGWEVSQKIRSAKIEASFVTAETDTPKPLPPADQALRAVPRFTVDAAAPIRLSLGFTIPEKRRPLLRSIIDRVEQQARAQGGGNAAPAVRVLGPIKATLESGRIDLAVQFAGTPPEPLTFLGVIGLKDSETAAALIPEFLAKLSENPRIESVEKDAATQAGVKFSRIQGKEVSARDQRILGESPAMYVGAGRDAFWLALGGKQAPDELGRFVNAGRPAGNPPPTDGIQFAFSAGSLIAVPAAPGEENAPERRLLRDAFVKGKDQFTVDLVGTTTGPRLTISAEEGFLRLVGLAIAHRIDRK